MKSNYCLVCQKRTSNHFSVIGQSGISSISLGTRIFFLFCHISTTFGEQFFQGRRCPVRSKSNKFEHVWEGLGPCAGGRSCNERASKLCTGTPLWIYTDTTESITFPQLRWRAVTMNFSFESANGLMMFREKVLKIDCVIYHPVFIQ